MSAIACSRELPIPIFSVWPYHPIAKRHVCDGSSASAPGSEPRSQIFSRWIIKALLRTGLPLGPIVFLTVRGRRSGKPRTTPVDLFEKGGRSFLVSAPRQESSNWVRNLRVAGEGVLQRGRSRRAIAVVELPPEAAGALLKDVLGPRLALPLRGFVPRRTFSVPPDAALPAVVEAAHSHPVFEIIPTLAA